MQVKGWVAFVSFHVSKTPPSKALRERNVPPTDMGLSKIRWQENENARKIGDFWVAWNKRTEKTV